MNQFNVDVNGEDNRDRMVRNKHIGQGIPSSGNAGATAFHVREESNTSLGAHVDGFDPSTDRIAVAQQSLMSMRATRLLDGEYVEAASLYNVGDVHSTGGRDEWWDRARATAEYKSSGVPQFPDDETPGISGGNSLEGFRRTHRMKYSGKDVSVRMPSVTALNRFANELKEQGQRPTFDIPVHAVGAAGNVVQGWVRVTKLADGHWSTSPVGLTGNSANAVCEAVNAVAEARRGERRSALWKAGDLYERSFQRERNKGVELEKVTSSWVTGAAYDSKNKQMFVEMGGKTYAYNNVAPTEAAELLSSRSAGKAFHTIIGMGKKRRKESAGMANRCEGCRRFYSPAVEHLCPRDLHSEATPEGAGMNQAQRDAARSVLGSDGYRDHVSRMDHSLNR